MHVDVPSIENYIYCLDSAAVECVYVVNTTQLVVSVTIVKKGITAIHLNT